MREPDAFTLTQDLFEDWQEWCAENGERPSLTKIAFSRRVAERGMERGEEKTGRRGFRGIRVAARLVM